MLRIILRSDGSEGGSGFSEGATTSVYDAGVGAPEDPPSPASTNPPDGAASASGAASAEGAADGSQAAPYHTFGGQTWKTDTELNDFIQRGTMLHDDYTTKTQKHADEVRAHEQRVSEFNQQTAGHQQVVDENKRIREIIDSRPDVRQYLTQMLSQPQSPATTAANGQQYASNQVDALRQEFSKLLDEKFAPVTEFMTGYQGERRIDGILDGLSKDVRSFPNGSFPMEYVREELGKMSNSPNMLLEIATRLGQLHLAQNGGAAPPTPPAAGGQPRVAPQLTDGTRRAPGSGHNPPGNEAEIDHGDMNKAMAAARAEDNASRRR